MTRQFVAGAALLGTFLAGAPASAESLLEAILAKLHLPSSGGAFFTRGSDDQSLHKKRYGDLYDMALTGKAIAVTNGLRLRSPIYEMPKRVLALSDQFVVEVDLSAKPPTVTNSPIPAAAIAKLLHYESGRVAYLDDSGCVFNSSLSDAKDHEPIGCQLSDVQQVELVARTRVCGQHRLGERFQGEPATRIDVMLYPASQRVGSALTGGRTTRLNADPTFSPACDRVLFVSDKYVTD